MKLLKTSAILFLGLLIADGMAATAWRLNDLKVLLIVNRNEGEYSFRPDRQPDVQRAVMSVSAEAQCKFGDGRFSMKMPAGDVALLLAGKNGAFVREKTVWKICSKK